MLFALGQLVFGKTILSIRLLACVAVALVPWIAGVVYFSLAGALDKFIFFSNFSFNLMNMAARPPLSLHSLWLVAQRQVVGESGEAQVSAGFVANRATQS